MQKVFIKYIDYLEAERNASPYTVRNYIADLCGSKKIKGFFAFLKERGITSPEGVSRPILRDYLAYLAEQGVVKASIARKLSAIRSFYRYLNREGLITSNPLKATASPKLGQHLPSFLTVAETERLLSVPDRTTPQGQRDRAWLELLYASGLRVSELASLNLDQVDFDTNEIRVRGKGAKERVALMGQPAAEALGVYLDQGRPQLLGGKKKSDALFLNRYGGRLTERSVQKKLARYAGLSGIDKRVHPHMLRHTFATHLLDGGADLRVVQELLGHTNLSSTQIYTHITKSQARKVYLRAHPMAREKDEQVEQR